MRPAGGGLAQQLGTPLAVADLHPSPRTDVPHDVRLRLQAAWTRYADHNAPWDALLWPAFEVSWCAALERGRARSLYQQLDEGQAWVQSLALPVAASVAALRLPLLDGYRAALHVPVERAGYADDLPLVLTAAAEGGATLLDVRLVNEWTSNDTVAQLVRMAHARMATDDADVEGADGERVVNWRRACVYSPWSGTLRTTAVDALPAETWGAVWDVFAQVVGCEADGARVRAREVARTSQWRTPATTRVHGADAGVGGDGGGWSGRRRTYRLFLTNKPVRAAPLRQPPCLACISLSGGASSSM